VLASSPRSALVTVVRYRAQGTAETAELSTDVVLAEEGDRVHVFLRDTDDPTRLVAQGLGADEARDLIAALSSVGRSTTPDAPMPAGDSRTRAASSRVTVRIRERWRSLKSPGERSRRDPRGIRTADGELVLIVHGRSVKPTVLRSGHGGRPGGRSDLPE
jgi:hypothetical protein